MISRRSLDSQYGGNPANVSCSYFRYSSKHQSIKASQRHQRKEWSRKDDKKESIVIKKNPTQREFRKRIMKLSIMNLLKENPLNELKYKI